MPILTRRCNHAGAASRPMGMLASIHISLLPTIKIAGKIALQWAQKRAADIRNLCSKRPDGHRNVVSNTLRIDCTFFPLHGGTVLSQLTGTARRSLSGQFGIQKLIPSIHMDSLCPTLCAIVSPKDENECQMRDVRRQIRHPGTRQCRRPAAVRALWNGMVEREDCGP